jgi:hypothetical protein
VGRRALQGRRDTGLCLFWTPEEDAAMFANAKNNHFGTGDYRTFSFGVWNGNGANAPETNSGKHITLRCPKPFLIGERHAEAGASYIDGRYTSLTDMRDYSEHVFGVHLYLPPHIRGIQGEYYNGETEGGDVDGWYPMGLARPAEHGVAFLRCDEYDGPRRGSGAGNIFTRDRWSVGYQHQMDKKTEFTTEYDTPPTCTTAAATTCWACRCKLVTDGDSGLPHNRTLEET